MNKKNKIMWIIKEWKPYRLQLYLLLFLTLLSSIVTVIYPLLFKHLLETLEIILGKPRTLDPLAPILPIIWMLITVGCVRLIASFYPAFRSMMNVLFEYVLRNRYFKYILEKDYRFFLQFRTGDLVMRLTNDIQDFPKIGWFICSGIFRAFDSGIKIIFCVIVMFFLCWRLTLVVLLPLPLMIGIFYIIANKLHDRFQKNQEAVSEIGNQLEMTFSGIKIIKSYVCEEKYKRFFALSLEKRYHTEMNLVKINSLMQLIYEYIDYFAMISIILFGGYLVVQGKISTGTFYAFYTYLNMLIYPMLDLPQLFISGKQAFVCINRLDEIKDFPIQRYETPEPTVRQPITELRSIRFENVSFAYPDRNVQILNQLTFEIHKGEKLLILGKSGVGKSTILALITGILIPQSGEIYINDFPMREIDLESFRKLIGYVPQEPSLFSGTIESNVYFGLEDKEFEPQNIYYHQILEAVQINKEIAQFGEKDQTRIGYKGLTLSGGQKQRLAIARALYKKPSLLILDDITASIDAHKEELLWASVSAMFTNLTGFVVSHRLSALRYVDQVLLLENGSITAFGNHSSLINDNFSYQDFIQHHYDKINKFDSF